MTFNEQLMIQFFIDHYRERFPNCHIVIYDNSSTDKTVEIAKANGCEVRTYDSGGTLNDGLHMQIKNNCWKDAKTDWVLVLDNDEILEIDEQELSEEDSKGVTKIKSEGWSMVNMLDNFDLSSIDHGFRDHQYDKDLLFNKKYISEINYGAGCHDCSSVGKIIYSSKSYMMYHYKYINEDIEVNKNLLTAKRLSQSNKQHNWGWQCLRSEQQIRQDFKAFREKSILLPIKRKYKTREKMNITVYTTTFNEELMIQFMIDFYRARFPECFIVIYDNCSTDRTVEIAKANGCEVRHIDTHGVTDNKLLWDIKNTCWKDAKTDWVLVIDVDEELEINQFQLAQEDARGVTKIKSESWQMVNMKDDLDINGIDHGWRDSNEPVYCLAYDKDLLFNKKHVDINYIVAGCHAADSKGIVKNSKPYRMLHYKYINPNVFVSKQKVNRDRFTETERKNHWGVMSLKPDNEQYAEFLLARSRSVKILGKLDHFYQKIQGWFNFQNVYSDMISKLESGSHIVEVGAWKGASTSFLAVEAINSGKNIKIDVVDTWKGNTDSSIAAYVHDLNINNGDMFPVFDDNIRRVKYAINSIRLNSIEAAKKYNDNSLDFVFFDAANDYEDVKQNINSWLPKIKDGGYIGGHNYDHPSLPGVSQAVNEIFKNITIIEGIFNPNQPNNQDIGINASSWLVRK